MDSSKKWFADLFCVFREIDNKEIIAFGSRKS